MIDTTRRLAERRGIGQVAAVTRQVGDVQEVEHLSDEHQLELFAKDEGAAQAQVLSEIVVPKVIIGRQGDPRDGLIAWRATGNSDTSSTRTKYRFWQNRLLTSDEFSKEVTNNGKQDSIFIKDMPALLCAVLSVEDRALLNAVFPRVIDNSKLLRNSVQIMRSAGVVGRKSLGSAPKRLVRKCLDARVYHLTIVLAASITSNHEPMDLGSSIPGRI
ncbi:hypothetical protein BH20ACI3_BH20ACI3_29730 [soil metagenome]